MTAEQRVHWQRIVVYTKKRCEALQRAKDFCENARGTRDYVRALEKYIEELTR